MIKVGQVWKSNAWEVKIDRISEEYIYSTILVSPTYNGSYVGQLFNCDLSQFVKSWHKISEGKIPPKRKLPDWF
jgi:hypothetical protein